MENEIDWITERVDRLSDESQRYEILSELKTAICALSPSKIRQIASSLRLELIFDCLNSSLEKQVSEACDVLYPLLSSFEPVALLDGYEDLITRALAHPSPKLRALVLKELNRVVKTTPQLAERLCRDEILLSVVDTVAGCPSRNSADESLQSEEEEAAASRAAVNLLTFLCSSSFGIALFRGSSSLLNAIRENSLISDVIRFRFYETLVEIAVHSPEHLSSVVDSGLLTPMIREALGGGGDSLDILSQANALMLLGRLASPEYGARYVDDIGAAETLAGILAQSRDDVLTSSLLLPGLLKFFGGIAHLRPKEVLSAYPSFPITLFEAIEGSDLTIVGVAIETLGYIGMTRKGKEALYALHRDDMTKVLRLVGKMMVNSPTPHRVRVMNSVSCLISLKEEDQEPELISITQRWCEGLCPVKVGSTQWDSVEMIVSICQQPFPELQLAGHQLFMCLAVLPWGQRMIATCPGLLEFLTSYENEMGSVRESKHAISKALLESPSTANHLSESQMQRLTDFVRLGPYGRVVAPAEVAVDGVS